MPRLGGLRLCAGQQVPLSGRIRGGMAAAALVLAAGAASPLQQSLGGRVIGGFPGNALACLDKPTIEKIRSDPNKSLVAAYSACEDELSKRLTNFGLDELGPKASF